MFTFRLRYRNLLGTIFELTQMLIGNSANNLSKLAIEKREYCYKF